MVKAAPAASFIVAEAKFLLQGLVIALDPPPALGLSDEGCKGGIGRQGGEPVFGRFRLALGPLGQAPFLGARFAAAGVALRRADAYGGGAGRQFGVAALAPGDAPEGFAGQSEGEILGRDRLVGLDVAKARWPSSDVETWHGV